MADGGKSEDGILKDNRECSPEVRPASVSGAATRGEVIAEKMVRRIGKKIRQKSTMIKRGGRISGIRGCPQRATRKYLEVYRGSDMRDRSYHCTSKVLGYLFMTNPTVGGK